MIREITPEMGHNSGIPADMVRDELGIALKGFEARKKELLESAGRMPKITDNDLVGKAGDLQALISRLIDSIGYRYDEIIEPYQTAIAAGRGMRDRFGEDLFAAKEKAKRDVDAFRADQRRIAKEEQDKQREAEAALRAKAAAAKPAEAPAPVAPTPATPIRLAPVVGDYGSRTGDRAKQIFTIADPRKLPLDILNHSAVMDAIQRACRDLYKVKKTIKGVVITTDATTTVRK